MKRNKLAGSAIRLALAAALVIGGTLVVKAPTSHAGDMGCYGWFDYVYKSTGDLKFANWHFESCLLRKAASVKPNLLNPGPIFSLPDGKPIEFQPYNPGILDLD
ncbi:hypothetical protein ACFFNY_06000 [Paenibacillus hodogayensis]|uniref:Uncharacterized protein n=1 Tax=Paenibacillus hodogayensis TaxID=279208 RepID=A0ABV5VS90_9BACL